MIELNLEMLSAVSGDYTSDGSGDPGNREGMPGAGAGCEGAIVSGAGNGAVGGAINGAFAGARRGGAEGAAGGAMWGAIGGAITGAINGGNNCAEGESGEGSGTNGFIKKPQRP